jgi:hypothetical protein
MKSTPLLSYIPTLYGGHLCNDRQIYLSRGEKRNGKNRRNISLFQKLFSIIFFSVGIQNSRILSEFSPGGREGSGFESKTYLAAGRCANNFSSYATPPSFKI